MVGELQYEEVANKWPHIFAEGGIVTAQAFEEVQARAYSVEICENTLRFGFAYSDQDVFDAFQDGADLVGMMAPDECKITCITLTNGMVVYADLEWDQGD